MEKVQFSVSCEATLVPNLKEFNEILGRNVGAMVVNLILRVDPATLIEWEVIAIHDRWRRSALRGDMYMISPEWLYSEDLNYMISERIIWDKVDISRRSTPWAKECPEPPATKSRLGSWFYDIFGGK